MDTKEILEKGKSIGDNWYYLDNSYYKIINNEIIENYAEDKFSDAATIVKYSEHLLFDWYKLNNRYYLIRNGRVQGSTLHLIIDEKTHSYRFPTSDGYATILDINGYNTILPNSSISSINIFEDLFFICNTADGTKKELRRFDLVLFRADDIYRLENGEFIGVSNGIHNIMNLTEKDIKKKPISKNTVRWNNGKYEEFQNGIWMPIY